MNTLIGILVDEDNSKRRNTTKKTQFLKYVELQCFEKRVYVEKSKIQQKLCLLNLVPHKKKCSHVCFEIHGCMDVFFQMYGCIDVKIWMYGCIILDV